MTFPILSVLAIAAVALYLFFTERLRMDVVALLVLVSLALLGLVTPAEALSGFSNEATIAVASMFILAAGLENTGALSGLGRLLTKSRSPTVFLLVLFALLTLTSPFVNNTAVVAVFIPIVISASLQIGLPPTKALIPLSYVSQMTGVCTLIGTSTNLIVNSVAKDLGHRGFSMFEFAGLGALCLAAGCVYLLTLGRWLLPERGNTDLSALQESGHYVTELRVTAESACLGLSVEEAQFAQQHQVYVLELWRGEEKMWSPKSQQLQEGDILLVRGRWSRLQKLQEALALQYHRAARRQEKNALAGAEADEQPGDAQPLVLAEIMTAPNSVLVGHRIPAVERTLPRQSSILAIQRRGQVVRESLDTVRLAVGDILLVLMPEGELARVRSNRNAIVLSERSAPLPKGWRAPFALATMVAVVLAAALGVTSIAIAAVAGALVMVLARCVELENMYDAIDGRILLLMAGLLPLGNAVSSSGAAQFIVDHTLGLAAAWGPHVMLAALYLMALVLGELMSNSAAAVLLTPIAFSTAKLVDADPTPFIVAVAFSASTSFLTPVGYQTNTMVYSAGGYRFADFIKVGGPLNLVFWVVGVAFIPVFWPFHP
ncbi:TrkA-C domain-containing protein [Oryzisolibacter propanilivorax]|uniref:TrkA-C domain-containing protein n=1 Tax=Oryzisolibacter propanilivorax TaxID=1527607 RepID=A0A1G9QKR5_9BURK|nr:SLC13 family permease [Oryzisolibacter propanilivorax]SDM11097.1 TrkA-C domain-containing protein [Oryzisolibacter propanilivorax]